MANGKDKKGDGGALREGRIITQAEADILERALASSEKRLELDQRAVAYAKEKVALYDTEKQILKDEVGFDEARLEYMRAEMRVIQQNTDLTRERKVELQKILALAEEQVAIKRKLHAETAGLVEQVTGVSDKWKDGVVYSIWQSEQGIKKFTIGLQKAFSPANVLFSSIQKVAQSTMMSAKAFDGIQAELNATTGAGGRYNEQISEIAEANRDIGVGFAQSGKAIGDLAVNMTGFTNENKATQNELAATVAGLEKFGISGAQSAKTMDDLVKGFGMTASAAAGVQKDLAGTAMSLGIPPAQMAEGFAQAMPQLAAWGKQSVKIFKQIAAASKRLGVEMSTLLGFAGQFDTFETAASSVGKLNALMGGDTLNAYQMMNASEEKRIELLLESNKLNGVIWKDLNKFERMAFASAAGIKDMAEANKLFGGGLDAYRQAQQDLLGVSMSAEQLADRQKTAVSVQEKLNMLFESFAVMVAPLVSGLNSLMNTILGFGGGGKIVLYTTGILLAFSVALWQLVKMIGPLKQAKDVIKDFFANKAATQAAAGVAEASTLATTTATTTAIAAQETAMATATPIMGGYSTALRGVGTSAAGAAPGLAAAGGGMTAFAGPIYAVIAGVVILGLAVTFILSKIIDLVTLMVNSGESFTQMATSIAKLVGSFALLAGGISLLAFAAPGLLLTALAIGGIGIALKFISEDGVKALSGLGKVIENVAADSIPKNTIKIKTMFESIGKIDGTQMEHAQKLFHEIKATPAKSIIDFNTSAADTKMDLVVGELKKINNYIDNVKSGVGRAGADQESKIILKIDGEKIGSVLFPHINMLLTRHNSNKTFAIDRNMKKQ